MTRRYGTLCSPHILLCWELWRNIKYILIWSSFGKNLPKTQKTDYLPISKHNNPNQEIIPDIYPIRFFFPLCSTEKTKKTTYIAWFVSSLQSSKHPQSKSQVHISRQYFTTDINTSKTTTHYSPVGFLLRKCHCIYPREKCTLREIGAFFPTLKHL